LFTILTDRIMETTEMDDTPSL